MKKLIPIILLCSCLNPYSDMAKAYESVHKIPFDIAYAAIIISEDENIPTEITLAMAWKESRFNPNAIGAAGEQGLIQLYPKYHRKRCEIKHDSELRDINTNLKCGISYLSQLYKESFSITEALARYNGGKYYRSSVCQQYAKSILTKSKEYIL